VFMLGRMLFHALSAAARVAGTCMAMVSPSKSALNGPHTTGDTATTRSIRTRGLKAMIPYR